MARDIKTLESSMRKLQQSCAELDSHKYFDEFFQIIHHPGWTTVIDEFFVAAMIATMQDQVQNVTRHLVKIHGGSPPSWPLGTSRASCLGGNGAGRPRFIDWGRSMRRKQRRALAAAEHIVGAPAGYIAT